MLVEDQTLDMIREIVLEVADYFVANNVTLSVAESFTGGAIVESLVSVPGASTYLREGVICYTNDAKKYRLGVESATLERYGAVSEKTIREMIRGLLDSPLKPDYAVATTGNAGPGVEDKSERGVCYVAVGFKDEIKVKRVILTGDRRENISEGTLIALQALMETVNKQRGEI